MTNTTHKTSKLRAATTLALTTLLLAGCGGGETQNIKDKFRNISDDIKDDYRKFEHKLTNNEKSMSEILKSIFYPESLDEDFKKFVDKLTPEGGTGGLYVGHFVELDDGDNSDIDIGAIYFDVPTDVGGSVDGRISYQQQPCQVNRTLSTDTAIKVDNYITGKLSGSLDTPKFLDIKYVRDLDMNTPNLLTTFNGQFNQSVAGTPWVGSFQYMDGLGGKTLSSGEDNCHVRYTLASRSNFSTYPLDFKRGELGLQMTGNGSQAQLSWRHPSNTALVLVSQIDVSAARAGSNGYVRNQVFVHGERRYQPIVTATATNYAFVVQAFDNQNDLIGYEALVMDLPKAP